MQKKYLKQLSSILTILVFLGFALACGSTPAKKLSIYGVNIKNINDWTKGYEEKTIINNELSSVQLMEVTKIAMQLNEIKNISILEQNKILSFAILESRLNISKIPVKVKFSYAIAKSGNLNMKVLGVTEANSESAPFFVEVREEDLDEYKQTVIQTISENLNDFAQKVIKKSNEFN